MDQVVINSQPAISSKNSHIICTSCVENMPEKSWITSLDQLAVRNIALPLKASRDLEKLHRVRTVAGLCSWLLDVFADLWLVHIVPHVKGFAVFAVIFKHPNLYQQCLMCS